MEKKTWQAGNLYKKDKIFCMFYQKCRNNEKSIAFSLFLLHNESNIEMQSRFICVKCFPDRESLERRKE